MRKLRIIGTGTSLPKNKIKISDQIRYRAEKDETQLTLSVQAAQKALESANIKIQDIDLIVSASAVGIQPIPCTAALIHEQIAKSTEIPAIDINTSCTSFISALDVISYMIDAGKYKRVLLISSDLASVGLNPNQKESYELFGDGAAAVVLEKSNNDEGIIYSMQKTWSEGAHSTEVRGGLTGMHASLFNKDTNEDYLFDMKGREVLTLAVKKIPVMFEEFYKKSNLCLNDVDVIIPHQASKALGLIMRKIGIPKDKYIDKVKEYGNMVSTSVPFILCNAIEQGNIKKGNTVILCGTAAGLTANILAFKY